MNALGLVYSASTPPSGTKSRIKRNTEEYIERKANALALGSFFWFVVVLLIILVLMGLVSGA